MNRKRTHQQRQQLRPVDHWRNVRTAARGMSAPMSVLAVLDHLVETQALNRHWRLPRIRLGYGRHSEKERAWDYRRRVQVAQERGERRLVQLPRPQRDGFAEILGCNRRTVIRAMHWLVGRTLVQIHHEHGSRPLADRNGVEHMVGRGGCLPGGVGCAATWSPATTAGESERAAPDVAPIAPEPEPAPRQDRPPLSSFLGSDPRGRNRGP
jgi:hypothetical protein